MNKTEKHLLNPSSLDFCMLDYECAYIPEKTVRMNYRYIKNASKSFNTAVIQRGWRRFGYYYFHPICNGCNECKSLKISVNDFNPTSSQKKAMKRNKNTKVIIQKPSLTNLHISVYNKYHNFKSQTDGWKQKSISRHEYSENFVAGAHDFGKEVLYLVDDKLVGVDLIDIVDDGISSIYFYYDPDYSRLSLGTYSLLYQIELAKILDLKWIYLGYWVDGCKAFMYKENFKPLKILDGFPDLEIKPNWEEIKNEFNKS
jgi:arginine-tRNA-protein transferase